MPVLTASDYVVLVDVRLIESKIKQKVMTYNSSFPCLA